MNKKQEQNLLIENNLTAALVILEQQFAAVRKDPEYPLASDLCDLQTARNYIEWIETQIALTIKRQPLFKKGDTVITKEGVGKIEQVYTIGGISYSVDIDNVLLRYTANELKKPNSEQKDKRSVASKAP